MSDSFYLRTKSYTITEDGFMHKHQASLDSQREEAEINWLFPEDDEPSDYEIISNFGTKWHDRL